MSEGLADGVYLRRESNPDLKFRKLLFYPLNYRGGITFRENTCGGLMLWAFDPCGADFVAKVVFFSELHGILECQEEKKWVGVVVSVVTRGHHSRFADRHWQRLDVGTKGHR